MTCVGQDVRFGTLVFFIKNILLVYAYDECFFLFFDPAETETRMSGRFRRTQRRIKVYVPEETRCWIATPQGLLCGAAGVIIDNETFRTP